MDINVFRGVMTLVTMLLFVVLCIWIYSKKNKATYDKASKMALEGNDSNLEEKKYNEVSSHE